jgi:hypothetical protein
MVSVDRHPYPFAARKRRMAVPTVKGTIEGNKPATVATLIVHVVEIGVE